MRSMNNKIIEAFAVLILIGFVMRMLVTMLVPILPYIGIITIIGVGWFFVYRKMRRF